MKLTKAEKAALYKMHTKQVADGLLADIEAMDFKKVRDLATEMVRVAKVPSLRADNDGTLSPVENFAAVLTMALCLEFLMHEEVAKLIGVPAKDALKREVVTQLDAYLSEASARG